MHSFGLYIHNDTLLALGRTSDCFDDKGLQVRPILCLMMSSVHLISYVELLRTRILRVSQNIGSADLMLHYIHAFTIHTTLLILLKGLLYTRSSRLVSDKLSLGYRYPCDGPGRGGTCQISSWDHLYLSLFWMYNSVSVFLFHFFWKMQSDV